MDRRSLVRVGLWSLPAVVLAGCLGSPVDSPLTWWELEAPEGSGSAAPDPARARKSLVVEGIAAGVLYDGVSLLYSRAPGVRSSYQFASWTERPAARIARLAKWRLHARGGFRDVSTAEAGVAPDLLLTLTLERLYHDLTVEPGLLRLELLATLTDWHRRRPIATRRFEAQEPVEGADAGGAAAAAGRAVGRVLDEVAPWVELSALSVDPVPQPARGRSSAFSERPFLSDDPVPQPARDRQPVPLDGRDSGRRGAAAARRPPSKKRPPGRAPAAGSRDGRPTGR